MEKNDIKKIKKRPCLSLRPTIKISKTELRSPEIFGKFMEINFLNKKSRIPVKRKSHPDAASKNKIKTTGTRALPKEEAAGNSKIKNTPAKLTSANNIIPLSKKVIKASLFLASLP